MSTRTRQTGISLIEMMIAMALGLILVMLVSQIFVNSKQAYRAQEGNAKLQENGRFAMEYIGRVIRHADFWSGVEADVINIRGAVQPPSGATTCNSAWITDVTQGIRGYDGATTTPIDCIPGADYVPNTDVVVARYVDPDDYETDAEIEVRANAKENRVYLRSAVGQFGILYNLAGTDPNNWASVISELASGADEGFFNQAYRTSVLFLRPCSAKVGTTCTATADGGQPIPTLVASELTASGTSMPLLQQNPLVEQVEQLQIDYGFDTNGDRAVDRYYPAAAVPAWERVVSVRVGVIVRGDALDDFLDTETYAMPGGYTYIPAAAVQRYPRRLMVKDFQIRNRTRG